MAGESLTSDARRALPIRNRFTKPSKEKPSSVGRASSPCKTNLSGVKDRKATAISGKAPVRFLPVLDCKEIFSSSRKARQRNAVPLRLVHPFFANGKAFHSPSLHRSNGGAQKFVYRACEGPHRKWNLLSFGVTSILPWQGRPFKVLLSSVVRISQPELPYHSPQLIKFTTLDCLRRGVSLRR